MKLEDFLSLNIEEYLFKDLNNLAAITVPKGEVGEASYPMLASILAGMELLGMIVSQCNPVEKVNKKLEIDGNKHFTHFWIYYLSQYDKKYSGFNRLFYDLLRNGIVHSFMVKQHIIVYKTTLKHMHYSMIPSQLVIGCNELFKDFQGAYFQLVLPMRVTENSTTHVNRDKMQSNLDSILGLYSSEADIQFAQLKPTKFTPSFTTPYTPMANASQTIYDIDDLYEPTDGTVTPSGIKWIPKKH